MPQMSIKEFAKQTNRSKQYVYHKINRMGKPEKGTIEPGVTFKKVGNNYVLMVKNLK